MSLVLGIAGHAKSGKTTLARAIGDQTGWPVASFGEEVLAIAHERGLPLGDVVTQRTTLMRLGERLVATDLEAFCARVLAQGRWSPGRSLVVEGIRHVVVVHMLERLAAPTPFRLVLVETPGAMREQRLREAGVGGPLTRATMDAHSTEREVTTDLAAFAHAVVPGDGDPTAAAARVLADFAAVAAGGPRAAARRDPR